MSKPKLVTWSSSTLGSTAAGTCYKVCHGTYRRKTHYYVVHMRQTDKDWTRPRHRTATGFYQQWCRTAHAARAHAEELEATDQWVRERSIEVQSASVRDFQKFLTDEQRGTFWRAIQQGYCPCCGCVITAGHPATARPDCRRAMLLI